MKLLSLNMELDQHVSEIDWLLMQEHPDVCCFQEISQARFNELAPRYRGAVFAPMVSPTNQPFGEWGVALLTQFPLSWYSVVKYDAYRDDYPEFHGTRSERPLATVIIGQGEGDLPVLAVTHFTWSNNGNVTEEQRVNLKRLITTLETYPTIVLCGDMNTPRGSDIYHQLTREFRDEIPASWTSTLDPNFHRAKGVQLVVDYIWSRGAVFVNRIRKIAGVSDHLGILCNIEYNHLIPSR